jgi:hypothetical protein
MTNATIPGLFPLSQDNADKVLHAAADGSVRGRILRGARGQKRAFQVLLKTRENKLLFSDPIGKTIIQIDDDYFFYLRPVDFYLPHGTSYLKILVDGCEYLEFSVWLGDAEFRPSECPVCPEECLAAPAHSLTGTQALNTGDVDVIVEFPRIFQGVPSFINPVVENISSDADKIAIFAVIQAKSPTGFSVRLSAAPPTSNYFLTWQAIA